MGFSKMGFSKCSGSFSIPFKKTEKTLDLKTLVYNLTVLDALLLFAWAIVFLGNPCHLCLGRSLNRF